MDLPEYDVPVADFDYNELAAYLQDDIQLTDKFLVTAGVRWSTTSFPKSPLAVQMVKDTFGYDTSHMPEFSGFSPRLSFTYDLGNQEKVLRGGVALLVGRAPTVLARQHRISTERTILSLSCTAAGSVPTLNSATLAEMSAANKGEKIRRVQERRSALHRPEYTLFSEDFKLPKTLKGSLGYEHLFPTNTRSRSTAFTAAPRASSR